jgi:peptide/nickel transport system permease protein
MMADTQLATSVDEPAPSRAFRGSGTERWLRYLAGRAGGVAAIAVVLLILTFLLVQFVPGDPARSIVGVTATQDQVDVVRQQLGLDDPFLTQAWSYISGIFHGDLGTSFTTQQPVVEMIAQRLPLTAEVAVGGLLVVVVVGFPLGLGIGFLERSGKGRRTASAFTAVTSVIGALPEYITGTLLIFVFALTLRLLPAQGGGSLEGLLLPALAVGLAPSVVMARIVRNETRSVLGEEYISTARGKRITTSRLLLTHVFPNVVTSTLTLGGLLLIALLGGTVIVENVFNIAGLGTQIVQAIFASDYPSIQGIILVLGLLAALVGLAIDVVLAILDPRVLQTNRSS